LLAGADNSEARRKILRYTTPFSLAGVPVVTIPRENGGVQLIAPHGQDPRLLQYAAWLGDRLPTS
jgi:aspartyl-tRNA(Asn)/glutamyl-tRNA(Gln) amidotransferase subunit A